MIKLEMYFSWFLSFIIGIVLLVALSVAEFFLELFDLPFDTWEIIKEKYEEPE